MVWIINSGWIVNSSCNLLIVSIRRIPAFNYVKQKMALSWMWLWLTDAPPTHESYAPIQTRS